MWISTPNLKMTWSVHSYMVYIYIYVELGNYELTLLLLFFFPSSAEEAEGSRTESLPATPQHGSIREKGMNCFLSTLRRD
jgi:hypothetical protein